MSGTTTINSPAGFFWNDTVTPASATDLASALSAATTGIAAVEASATAAASSATSAASSATSAASSASTASTQATSALNSASAAASSAGSASASASTATTQAANAASSAASINVNLRVGTSGTYQSITSYPYFLGYGAGASFPMTSSDQFGTLGIGSNALHSLTAVGTENTAIGASAGYSLTTGGLNTAVGMHALGSATTTTGVVAVGNDAFRDSFPAGYNIAIGQHSQAHGAPGGGVVAIGSQTVRGASSSIVLGGTVTTGDVITVTLSATVSTPGTVTGLPASASHTVSSSDTLATIASALASSLNGTVAGPVVQLAVLSTANPDATATISFQWDGTTTQGWALSPSVTVTGAQTETYTVQPASAVQQTVVIGNNAMVGLGLSNPTGNTVVGENAGNAIRTAGYNALYGVYAGQSLTTGGFNTALGALTGLAMTTGQNNTIVGGWSGAALTTGSNNVIVGQKVAHTTLTTGSNNIYIGGPSIDAATAGESGTLRIGNNGTNLCYSTGIDTTTPTTQWGGSFAVAGGLAAFGATPPSSKPTITGSRSTATASVLAQLLTALNSTGLILDFTTP